jgi:predicted GNAT family acetyltransferase
MGEVIHNQVGRRFEMIVEGGLAHADYRRSGDVLEMVHTEVPQPDTNRGVAAALVTSALAYARGEGLTVLPTCPYVRAFMRKRPETHDLLAPGAQV